MSAIEQPLEPMRESLPPGPLDAYVRQILSPSWWSEPASEAKAKPREKTPEMAQKEPRALILKAINESVGKVGAKDIQDKTNLSISCIRQYCAKLVFEGAIALRKEKAAVWWEKKNLEEKRARARCCK